MIKSFSGWMSQFACTTTGRYTILPLRASISSVLGLFNAFTCPNLTTVRKGITNRIIAISNLLRHFIHSGVQSIWRLLNTDRTFPDFSAVSQHSNHRLWMNLWHPLSNLYNQSAVLCELPVYPRLCVLNHGQHYIKTFPIWKGSYRLQLIFRLYLLITVTMLCGVCIPDVSHLIKALTK